MVKVDRIQLDEKGLKKFFSPIEARIMDLLWKRKKATSVMIQKCFPDLSVACIAGTLDRLVKSGFVKKEIDGSTKRVRFLYIPTSTKNEAGTKISERILESLIDTFGTSVVDTFDKIKTRRK